MPRRRPTDASPRRLPRAVHLAAPVVGLGLIAAAAFAHHAQTAALRDPAVLEAAAGRLDALPTTIGPWTATDLDLPPREVRLAEANGGLARRYTREDGAAVEVLLLAGPQGPISLHPPTVCYRGAGYTQCSEVDTVPVAAASADAAGDGNHRFAAATFEKEVDGREVRIRTLWGWGTGGSWDAPDTPRVAFAGEPYLYKLYVTETRPYDPETEAEPAREATREFLAAFLPAAADALATPAAG